MPESSSSPPLALPSPPPLDPQFELAHYTDAATLPPGVMDACIALVTNIKFMYLASGMGWNNDVKRSEFRVETMEFLVIYDKDKLSDTSSDGNGGRRKAVAAFANVLPRTPEIEPESEPESDDDIDQADFVPEVGLDVSYLYEFHVAPSYQSRGLAQTLLHEAQVICVTQPLDSNHSQKLMLTVFNMNVPAQNFYLWNGFRYYDEGFGGDLEVIGRNNGGGRRIDNLRGRKRTAAQNGSSTSEKEEDRHRLHPDLPYTQVHRSIKGWRQMVWSLDGQE